MEIRKLSIRQLTDDQFEQIVSIEQTCGLEPYSREMLLDCIANLDTCVCMDGNTVAGFITILPYPPVMGGRLYVVNINVAGAYRRRGIGQRLMVFACGAYAASHHGRTVTLDVAKDNTAAITLYQKLGFVSTGIPSRNGETDMVMIAKLNELISFLPEKEELS